jgi:hypothetical protein
MEGSYNTHEEDNNTKRVSTHCLLKNTLGEFEIYSISNKVNLTCLIKYTLSTH